MKSETEIEQLLTSGKKLSLTTREKSSIKATLIEHATETIRHEIRGVPSPWSSWLLRSSVSFASLLLVFVGTAYASHSSLPGEPLYAMKVHVVEEMIALTKVTPEAQVAYDTGLMEKRLSELQLLVAQEEIPSPEALDTVAEQITEHVAHAHETLTTKGENELPPEEKINALAKLKGVAKAQSKISAQEQKLASMAEPLNEVETAAEVALISAVEDFVETETPETVNEYLSDHISAVGNQISTNTTDEGVRDTVEQHLSDVHEALVDGNTEEALTSIIEAREVINVDVYIGDSAVPDHEIRLTE